MLHLFYFAFVLGIFLVVVTSEGISHSSHLMLKAAEKGDTKTVIDYITKTGVPLNVKNNYGVSAIIFAANNGHRELLEALVNVGANIEDRSNNWRTPLNWASHWGHYDCVVYLVGAGANVSTFDSKGMTPLMSAALNGNPRVVQFLLDHGANPLTRNVYNGTALSIAQVQNNTALVSLLEPYYPAGGDDSDDASPYVIMSKIVLAELKVLGEMLRVEVSKLYAEVEAVVVQVYKEVVRRWQQYQDTGSTGSGSTHDHIDAPPAPASLPQSKDRDVLQQEAEVSWDDAKNSAAQRQYAGQREL